MEIIGGEIRTNELSDKAAGGSELLARRIAADLDKDLLKEYQIIISRVRELDSTKIRLLLLQDLPEDPESKHLANEGWRKFHRIVFVSHWQREQYVRAYGIPYSKTIVIHNAIVPFTNDEDLDKKKKSDRINVIYHTTPHRGLEILVPVFAKLAETHNDIHLDVFSSFDIYGWPDRNKPYEPLFEQIKNHPNMTYHGYKTNEVVRAALERAHVFAYPSIWRETSCMSLMEAMSAKCYCVHSDLAALAETSANWSYQYNYNENVNAHASTFYNVLDIVLQIVREKDKSSLIKLNGQKSYADLFYNWTLRIPQWNAILSSLINEPREIDVPKKMFIY